MAKARKLKSGNWNIQVFDYRDPSGKAHFTSITAPTKLDCEIKARLFQREHPKRDATQEMTVGTAVDRYIALCGVQSPTTSLAYKKVRENAFCSLMSAPVKKLTNESVQKAINEECQRIRKGSDHPISAKTVHNEWGLVSAALRKICNLTFDVTLPKIKKDRKQYPDPQKVLTAIMDSPVKLPCLLSMWCTFSMSELLGIKCSSIQDGYIYINQVRVYTEDGWIEKSIAKNATRNRVQKIPKYLMDLIKENDVYKEYLRTGADGYLFPKTRDAIYNAWTRTAQKHGLSLSFHDLRHMSASVMLQLNVPEKYAQERGGWATPNIMRTVYQHTFSAERIAVDQTIDSYFEKSLNGQYERPEENP